MPEIDFEKIGLKVGLEIHQQLNTNKKLFCKCRPIESDEYTEKFSRSLRMAKSELGELDPAALFEKKKSKKINYYANSQSSCLVEKDEEPPHNLDHDAKEVSLLISGMLESKIFGEIHVMRKTVIDGSNTTGFQRTMLVSQGGNLKVGEKKIGVQAVCLEEDAAKLLSNEQNETNYSLDRLGVPLVEIALEPVSTKPSEVKEIALTLGRNLRVTGLVKRGIGSIRQDVNISVSGGGGVVEVKGVQQLDQLEKIIGYEAKRQHGLIQISEKLKKLSIIINHGQIFGKGKDWTGWDLLPNEEKAKIDTSLEDVFDITQVLKECESKIIQKALKSKAKIKAIRIRNFSGMFGFEPYPGIRLGKEIGQLVRFFGIGGVFHSDELPDYGINDSDVDKIRKHLEIVSPLIADGIATNQISPLADQDGFLIIAGEDPKLGYAVNSIVKRIQDAVNGVPAETRAATQDGETVFLRPRPGASRMYPETDIPSISIMPEEVKRARDEADRIPTWDEAIAEIQKKYNLNKEQAEQIFDSEYVNLFEKICKNKKNSPNFVASILCSSITNLERQGFDATLLKPEHIIESFELLASSKIPKESLEIIFESIMSGKSENVSMAMQSTNVSSMDEVELNGILDKIIQNNIELVKKLGDQAITTLMGLAMKEVRGKASGKMVNDLLRKKVSEL